jgi:hypothetical protein
MSHIYGAVRLHIPETARLDEAVEPIDRGAEAP